MRKYLVRVIPQQLRLVYRRLLLGWGHAQSRRRHLSFLKRVYLPKMLPRVLAAVSDSEREKYEELFRNFAPAPHCDRSVVEVKWPGYPHSLFLRRNSSDIPTFCQVFIEEQYHGMAATAGRHDAVIDCGANIGLASAWFLWKWNPRKIVAIEPDSGNYAICWKNLAAYGEQAIVVQGALWHTPGCELVVDDPGQLEWSLRCRPSTAEDAPKSKVRTYDMNELLQIAECDRAGLVKIDIEGGESELFCPEANSALWLDRTENLAIELHGPECQAAVQQAMQQFMFTENNVSEVTWFTELHRRPVA